MTTTINEEIANIKELIEEGKLREAYSLVNKLLLNFPENRKLQKLQEKVEKIVYEQNLAVVKKELAAIKPFWKDKRYVELITKLQELQNYVPGYAPVEKQLYKAQKLYQKNYHKMQQETKENYIKDVAKLIKEKKFSDAITLAKRFLLKYPEHDKCKDLLRYAKASYIDDELKKNKKLLESDKYDEIQKFLNGLLKYDQKHEQIHALLRKAMKKEDISLDMQKKEFTYMSYDQIFTLFQKKKYSKTIEGLKEMLKVDPDNLKALELLKKARIKFNRKVSKEVIKKMLEKQKVYKKLRREHPKDYIKV